MYSRKLAQALMEKGYRVSYFDTSADAVEYLTGQVNNCTVGFGDSMTLTRMLLSKKLSKTNQVFDPGNCAACDFVDQATKALTAEVFFTSVNAVAETGEMVNLDGTGNRIAGSLFGHRKVYFVFGINKIEPTLEQAILRARNIAGPLNAKRLSCKTPCAAKGDRCYDCSSPERICNAMTIYFRKMDSVDSEIIIINELLGL